MRAAPLASVGGLLAIKLSAPEPSSQGWRDQEIADPLVGVVPAPGGPVTSLRVPAPLASRLSATPRRAADGRDPSSVSVACSVTVTMRASPASTDSRGRNGSRSIRRRLRARPLAPRRAPASRRATPLVPGERVDVRAQDLHEEDPRAAHPASWRHFRSVNFRTRSAASLRPNASSVISASNRSARSSRSSRPCDRSRFSLPTE